MNLLIFGATKKARENEALAIIKNCLCSNKEQMFCDTCRNCTRVNNKDHPNVHIIAPSSSSKEIKIGDIKEIIAECAKYSFEEGETFFLFTQANKLSKKSANAILKTLEESFSRLNFIALAPTKKSVLSTIFSRFTYKHLMTLSCELSFASPEGMANKITEISRLTMHLRASIFDEFIDTKDQLYEKLEELFLHADRFLLNYCFEQESFNENILVTMKIRDAIEKAMDGIKNNKNNKLVVGELLFNDWPQYDFLK